VNALVNALLLPEFLLVDIRAMGWLCQDWKSGQANTTNGHRH
jgi:hypothetical protein